MPTTYESLAQDKVAFLQGTQAQLNKYLPVSSSAERGTAQEGAFYLTTDTHRLYVGRKVNDSNSADNGKIFPVQVSAGITTVYDTQALVSASTDGEKGDMYYVQEGNVLCVLEIAADGTRSWVQVNPPTGIETYTNSLSQVNATLVRFTSTISTQAQQNGTKTSRIDYIAGQNITLTAAEGTSNSNPSLTIASSAYEVGTEATATGSHNGGTFGLYKDSGNSFDSSISIAGDTTTTNGTNTVAAVTDNNGNIKLHGPRFTNVTADNANQGFKLKLNYFSPLLDASTSTTPADFDPIIQVGTNASLNGVTYTPQSVHFSQGIATLPIYTRAEVDSKISEYISAEFETANAMNYRGTVTSAADLASKYTNQDSSSNAHKGDTYKVATSNAAGFEIGTGNDATTVYNGDLIILNGNESADGTIPLNAISFDVVPSGDEIQLGVETSTNNTGIDESVTPNVPYTSRLTFKDTKTNGLGAIVNARFTGSDYINISSTYNSDYKNFDLTFDHEDVARTNTTTALDSTNSNDLMNNTYTFFMLQSASDIVTDSKGHVTGITGKTVQLRHNKLAQPTSSYLTSTSGSGLNAINTGSLRLSIPDILNNSVTGNLSLTSQTLTFDAPSGATSLNVELLWGSF